MQCQKLKTYMETGRVVFLPAKSIRPNPAQPRKIFREDALDELADSIREVQVTLGAYVHEISETLEVIATGDLTKDFKKITDFRGEFGSIKTSFVKILKEFNITLSRIQDAAADVDSGSDEIAGAAADLASGTGEQASAVEELTAMITDVFHMSEKNAEDAQAYLGKLMAELKVSKQDNLIECKEPFENMSNYQKAVNRR